MKIKLNNKSVVYGRNDTTLTLLVSSDCKNNCPLCTSKQFYKNKTKLDKKSIETHIKTAFFIAPIRNVVISGGEPLYNIDECIQFIDFIKTINNNVKIYLNTTLPNIKFSFILKLFNKLDGVSVSRHASNKMGQLHDDIVDKEKLINIFQIFENKSNRINCVIDNNTNIDQIIEYWKNDDIIIPISFRENMADFKYNVPSPLLSKFLKYPLQSFSKCKVCEHYNYGQISFHRGSIYTSIEFDENIEINDLIIMPDGRLCYDWDVNKFISNDNLNIEYPKSTVQLKMKNDDYDFSCYGYSCNRCY